MKESKYTRIVYNLFNSQFPQGWIDKFYWTDTPTDIKFLREGIEKIHNFRLQLFLNYSKLVLSGDHLINDTSSLEELDKKILQDNLSKDDSYKSKLTNAFYNLQEDIHDALMLVKYHCSNTINKYDNQDDEPSINAISNIRFSSRNKLVKLLEMICDTCWIEYNFSNDDSHIRALLKLKENIDLAKKQIEQDISEITGPTIRKIDFLLVKLSYFSKNKKIRYTCNFNPTIIKIIEPTSLNEQDFNSLFYYFLFPEKIDRANILEWQKESLEEDVCMWKFAFLMRFYTQTTKSLEQIENLINLADKHYNEYIKDTEHNRVNDYANRSFRNYMHNSRFSVMCHNNNYTFDKMKSDLEKIRGIQNETFIFNYHPYQKAIEYTIRYLEKKISSRERVEDLNGPLSFLKNCFEKFKENIAWCKNYQPYLMQMRFKFCSEKDGNCDLTVFYPSSFCRPLKFQSLNEKVAEYHVQISHLEYNISHISDREDLIKAQKSIADMEKKNMQLMGLFATTTTFLVGLLSIFIGNNGKVSIFEKIEYVIALGFILLMFICIGYIATSEVKKNKGKTAFFLFLLIVFCIFLTLTFKNTVK